MDVTVGSCESFLGSLQISSVESMAEDLSFADFRPFSLAADPLLNALIDYRKFPGPHEGKETS